MLANRNSFLAAKQWADFIHTQFARVCVNIHVCYTQTLTRTCICLCVGKLQFSYLMVAVDVVCCEPCALFVGSLSKANSEIKAHKFILTNSWNKRKPNGQGTMEVFIFVFSRAGCAG